MRLEDYPGYKEAFAKACRKEASLRSLAFFPAPPLLCGVPVLPFTPRHFIILDQAGSPWFGHPSSDIAGEICQFLWVVSPGFVVPSRDCPLAEVRRRRKAFLGKVWPTARKRLASKCGAEIDAYIEGALFDRDCGGGSDSGPAAVHFAASLIDEFGAAYGWTADQTLDTPFAQLFQLRRARRLRQDADATLVNRLSDQVEKEVIRRHLAREQAKATKKKGRKIP